MLNIMGQESQTNLENSLNSGNTVLIGTNQDGNNTSFMYRVGAPGGSLMHVRISSLNEVVLWEWL